MEEKKGGAFRRTGAWLALSAGLLLASAPATAAGEAPSYVKHLVELSCGNDETCRTRLLADDPSGGYMRQLAGHYLVTAFTELGTARIEDDSSRGNLAPYILQRAQVAEAELHEACKARTDTGVAGAVAYPLERADAIVAVADAMEAGTRPSRQRLLAALMNPQAALEAAAEIFKNAIGDKLYADAYRQSFKDAQDYIYPKQGKESFDKTAWTTAWQTMEKRLNAQCRALVRITGGRVGDEDNPCEVASKYRCSLLPAKSN